jgi:hypothetical protein
MGVSGVQEHFVPAHQRVNNTRINLYTLDQHLNLKKQDQSQQQQRLSEERVKQARADNKNLGQNVDIYC